MVIFNEYVSPMERVQPDSEFKGVDVRDIGISTHPGKEQVEQLKARIFAGASRVELGFFGSGKAAQGAFTPESYGKEDRQAIRELAQINKINLTTHAAPAIGALSGFDPQQGKFSKQKRNDVLTEIKRSIEFAADTAGGGAVVLHTNEFPQPLSDKYGDLFQMHEDEPKEQIHYLVDPKTGSIISAVKEDEEIWRPRQKFDENNNPLFLKDEKGEILRDRFTGKPIPIYEFDETTGDIVIEKTTFSGYVKEKEKLGWDKHKVIKEFFKEQQEAEIDHQLGQAREYETHYYKGLEQRDKIMKSLQFYRQVKEKLPKEEWESYRQPLPGGPFIPPDVKDPIEYLEKALYENERQIAYGREIAIAGRKQAEKLRASVDRAQSMEDYGVEQTTETLAKAALFAYEQEKSKKLENPLYVAPENIFPEWGWGAHPQELKEMVLKSRDKMANMLAPRYGKSEAKKIAEQHIKAAVDIGHANTWRKYFKRKEGETIEQSDKRFNKWLIKEMQDLVDNKIIGHVHISDNFGYYDEHLTPGEGNAPIKEFVEKVTKAGVKSIITEPSRNDYKAMLGGWSLFGSSIYGIGTGGLGPSWLDVEHAHFGRTQPPNYLVGEFRPSEDWTLWSGVPLE